jgi:hypothetical protein
VASKQARWRSLTIEQLDRAEMVAYEAAFPDLPESISGEEAHRRVAAALTAVLDFLGAQDLLATPATAAVVAAAKAVADAYQAQVLEPTFGRVADEIRGIEHAQRMRELTGALGALASGSERSGHDAA